MPALMVGVVAAGVGAILAATTSNGTTPTPKPGAFAGYDWSGEVTSVQASWTVPRILPSSGTGHASTWISAATPSGAGPFIQIGTDEALGTVGTQHAYYDTFWSDTDHRYQWQPIFLVSAGDAITASLTLARGRWRLAIEDRTSHASSTFTTSDEAHASFTRASWLEEHVMDPADGDRYPRISPITFRHITVDSIAPNTNKLSSYSMALPGNQVLAPGPVANDSFKMEPVPTSPPPPA